jgi:phospholipid/cholesterol/gamma-HCH transport system permease protein
MVRSLRDAIARLGSRVLNTLALPAASWHVLIGTLAGVAHRLRGRPVYRRGEVVRQLYSLGNRSLWFVVITLGFIGMVMAYQSCLQVSKITGDPSQIGPQFLRLVVSDFGATLTGMMLSTRVGAGIAAELGSMKVNEQIDALRMFGVSPIDYLVVPRFVASIVMTVGLSVIGCAAMIGAAGLTAQFSFAVNPHLFFDVSAVTLTHIGLGLIKAVSYGMAIPVIASACGLSARGSSEGVGWATTAAVIGSSFAVLVLDFLWSTAAYVGFQGKL